METYDTITTEQLAKKLQIGETKAQDIMRGIKLVSDTLEISGLCHIQDYNAWLSKRLGNIKSFII